MLVSALVLRDIVEDLDFILDKTVISELNANEVTVRYELCGVILVTRFTGDGMSYTTKGGDESEAFVFDNHTEKKFLEEVIKHFF